MKSSNSSNVPCSITSAGTLYAYNTVQRSEHSRHSLGGTRVHYLGVRANVREGELGHSASRHGSEVLEDSHCGGEETTAGVMVVVQGEEKSGVLVEVMAFKATVNDRAWTQHAPHTVIVPFTSDRKVILNHMKEVFRRQATRSL